MEHNNELYIALSSRISDYLNSIQVEPITLEDIPDERRFIDELIQSHTTRPDYISFKERSKESYIATCAYHAFGLGFYLFYTMMETDDPYEFTPEQITLFEQAVQSDPFKTMMAQLDIHPESFLKEMLDRLMSFSICSYLKLTNSPTSEENIRILMFTLYELGETLHDLPDYYNPEFVRH
ncbi:MAG: hypothetical protein HUJ58_08060 [Erysipelotrichaceae bacterium]|nr:hypothetical protein [Erysipelotrichaceae bacterium]